MGDVVGQSLAQRCRVRIAKVDFVGDTAEAVIHTAFTNISETTDFATSLSVNRSAIDAMGEALAGSDRSLVFTAGITPSRTVTEDDVTGPESMSPFGEAEGASLAWRQRGVRVAAMRLPLSVHGDTDARGFIPTLVAIARATGTAAYVDDGASRWPAVHVRDAARLFRLAVEATPPGARLHAVADEAVPMSEIAAATGTLLDLPVRSIPADEAGHHFSWFTPFVAMDSPATGVITAKRFDWTPAHSGLIADPGPPPRDPLRSPTVSPERQSP